LSLFKTVYRRDAEAQRKNIIGSDGAFAAKAVPTILKNKKFSLRLSVSAVNVPG